MTKKRCECDTVGRLFPGNEWQYDKKKELPFVNHEPGKCKCTNGLKQYYRDGKKIWLCSCCDLGSDVKVTKGGI